LQKYLKTADGEWYKHRIIGVMACILACFLLLMVRLIYLQVVMGEEYRRLSINNRIRLQSIDPPRGLVYDRTGNVLAENRPSFDVCITLKDAQPINETLLKLAAHLDESAAELMSKLKHARNLSAYKPYILKQDIGRDALAAIEVNKYQLPGITVQVNMRRQYLRQGHTAHLLGYLSEISSAELNSGRHPDCRRGDFIGKFGAEKAFENSLRGKRGGRQVEVNANGQVVRILKEVGAQPGQSIYLTIDTHLQQKAEELLDGVAGAVVAIHPNSGRILALASSPAFDQSAFVGGISRQHWISLISNPFRPMTNRAIQGEYPPGSIYKIITAIAGLEEGVIDEQTTFFCPGHFRFGNRTYRCWKKGGHGKVDIVKAITESCDVFFYQVGQRLGVDRLARYANDFGLGNSTGINLDQEATGLVPTSAWKEKRTGIPWQEGETLSIAIGQGFNLVTPVQMAVMISAVANGGLRYRPRILERIVDHDGKTIFQSRPELSGKLPVSQRTLDLVRLGLWRVVNGDHGTARGSRLDDIEMCGKTGTSQVISRRAGEDGDENSLPAHLKSHAWFVAYAPFHEPQIAVAVVVEHGEHGSGAAAPVAKELVKTYLRKRVQKTRFAEQYQTAPKS
jgi:penicillin-binding protein 2